MARGAAVSGGNTRLVGQLLADDASDEHGPGLGDLVDVDIVAEQAEVLGPRKAGDRVGQDLDGRLKRLGRGLPVRDRAPEHQLGVGAMGVGPVDGGRQQVGEERDDVRVG